MAKATNDVAELMVAVKVIKTPFVDIVSQHFVEHVNQGAMVDAMRDYDYLKGTSLGGLEPTTTPGASGVQYDATTDQYQFNWKTDSAWGGTCRQLILRLNDATVEVADFDFR